MVWRSPRRSGQCGSNAMCQHALVRPVLLPRSELAPEHRPWVASITHQRKSASLQNVASGSRRIICTSSMSNQRSSAELSRAHRRIATACRQICQSHQGMLCSMSQLHIGCSRVFSTLKSELMLEDSMPDADGHVRQCSSLHIGGFTGTRVVKAVASCVAA